MSNNQKKFIVSILWLGIMAVSGYMLYQFFGKQSINPYGFFVISLFIASLFEFSTFRKITYLGGDSREEEKIDELEEHIVRESSKIAYFTLMIIILGILGAVEMLAGPDNQNFSNTPLMLALCASIVTLPIVQFIVSKKYR